MAHLALVANPPARPLPRRRRTSARSCASNGRPRGIGRRRAIASTGSRRRSRARPRAAAPCRCAASRSAIASAAGTMPQPGWVSDGACESSVSSACASMPLASAAFTAVVTMLLPITQRFLDAAERLRRKRSLFCPAARREPETIAAIVSRMWCLVFSTTACGKRLVAAPRRCKRSARA